MKAFIFDMDGVIVDSERVWQRRDAEFFGKQVNDQIKDQILGSTPQAIYKLAYACGLMMGEDDFYRRYSELARSVYDEAELTQGLEKLLETLTALNFKIGLVSSSPGSWIEQVLSQIDNRGVFDYVLSISDKLELRSKPAPDGYTCAMSKFGSSPEETIILEDSNNGIAAAKASGAYVIGLRENLESTYVPQGADLYVENLEELEKYLKGNP